MKNYEGYEEDDGHTLCEKIEQSVWDFRFSIDRIRFRTLRRIYNILGIHVPTFAELASKSFANPEIQSQLEESIRKHNALIDRLRGSVQK